LARTLDGSLTLEMEEPILFVTGNHDNAEWLKSLHGRQSVVPIDPLDIDVGAAAGLAGGFAFERPGGARPGCCSRERRQAGTASL
jgi:hypothetical protein